MAPVKASGLRTQTKDDLLKKLDDLKSELATLRVAQASGSGGAKLSKIKGVRRGIAAVLTVVNQKQRDELKKHFSKAKHVPVDLRQRRTRALRRVLSKDEAGRVTVKQAKKNAAFPARKYAVRA